MRYIYFIIKYNQWFRNLDGIKAFADQIMNWLLQETLGLADKLKKANTLLSEKINEYGEKMEELVKHPVIEADEFPAIKRKLRHYRILLWIFIIGEGFFNYFAAGAIFTSGGLGALLGRLFIGLVVTAGSIYIFEQLFFHIVHEKPYKSEHEEPRNIKKLVLLSIAGFVYECLVYYICKIRGIQIEGASGNGFISTAMMILGMLMPVIAGYFAYEINRYISAYKNTLNIENLKKQIAEMVNKVKINIEAMENHFKKTCQAKWALLQEFKTYKENYNYKYGIPMEDLHEHFCETERTFVEEAIARYSQNLIDIRHNDSQEVYSDYRINGNKKEILSNKLIEG